MSFSSTIVLRSGEHRFGLTHVVDEGLYGLLDELAARWEA